MVRLFVTNSVTNLGFVLQWRFAYLPIRFLYFLRGAVAFMKFEIPGYDEGSLGIVPSGCTGEKDELASCDGG